MSDYAFVHDGTAYTPNHTDVPTEQAAAHNAEIEARELEHWQSQPDRMLAYYRFPAERTAGPRQYRESFRPLLERAEVTTWPGTSLGRIISARVYRHNFGQRFVSI
jgi:hypothetical protein